jgi:hypothetical protein
VPILRAESRHSSSVSRALPISGAIVPAMGMQPHRTGLADALFTPVQQRVLGLLFTQPSRRYQSAELIRLAGSGTGATHRLLTKLASAGLVTALAIRSTTKQTGTLRYSRSFMA